MSTLPEAPATTGRVDLDCLLDTVNSVDCAAADAVLIERISALERLKAGCAATQARLTAAFTATRTADGAARHIRPDELRRSIAGQVALARRDSRYVGGRHVGVAAALTADLPCTLAALGRGELSERRARIVVEQFACLTPEGRRAGDELIGPELPGLGDRAVEARAAGIAYRLDPEAVMAKARGAVTDRYVSLRPAPETMSRFTALLPVLSGVSVYAALLRAADSAAAAGDPRSRGQVMADALVAKVTGVIVGCDDYGVPRHHPEPAPDTGSKRTDTTHTDTGGTDTDRTDTDRTDTARDGGRAGSPGSAAAEHPAERPAEDTGSTGTGGTPNTDTDHTDDADGTGNTTSTATSTTRTATSTTSTGSTGTGDTGTATATAAATGDASTGTGSTASVNTGSTPTARTVAPIASATTVGAVARAGCGGRCGVQVNLIMTDRTLLDGDDEPAHLHGHGPIPAALARALVLGAADSTTRTFVRRLYTDPTGAALTAMDSRSRLFPDRARAFLINRDHTCRTPWCDAPIRQIDHLTAHTAGGATTISNGQCLCQACNLTKQAPGWSARADPDGTIHTTTPTGAGYPSHPPPPPRSRPWADISFTEHRIAQMILHAS